MKSIGTVMIWLLKAANGVSFMILGLIVIESIICSVKKKEFPAVMDVVQSLKDSEIAGIVFAIAAWIVVTGVNGRTGVGDICMGISMLWFAMVLINIAVSAVIGLKTEKNRAAALKRVRKMTFIGGIFYYGLSFILN